VSPWPEEKPMKNSQRRPMKEKMGSRKEGEVTSEEGNQGRFWLNPFVKNDFLPIQKESQFVLVFFLTEVQKNAPKNEETDNRKYGCKKGKGKKELIW